jgi:hypothetical protein
VRRFSSPRIVSASLARHEAPSGCSSRLELPLNASAYFFVFDKLTPADLVQAHLHLLFEPVVIDKQLVNGLPQQLVSAPARFHARKSKQAVVRLSTVEAIENRTELFDNKEG